MTSWFSYCWIYLLIIVLSRKLSADLASPPQYIIHHAKLTFDQAMEDCSPGVLTPLATEEEVTNVLGVISKFSKSQSPVIFWVGLMRAKNECVIPTLPLRGFRWLEDGSGESQVSLWLKEPQYTCMASRCAGLQVEFDGSTVTRRGLVSDKCKQTYQFICKLRDGQATQTSKDRKTTLEPTTPEPATPEPRRATQQPTPAAFEPKLPTRGSEQETDLNLETQPELQGPYSGSGTGPVPGSDLCQHPKIPGARSLILHPNNSSRIQVECWSKVQLELYCWGHPTVWRLMDDSPANFSTLCQPCDSGFQKDTSGNCVDIDECSGGAPCRHTCLNTEGSYRCVCSDEDGTHHAEGSSECTDQAAISGILVPVLAVGAALVLLVVVVAVSVKCCLMRRSRKRAMKESEKMGMKNKDGQDSFATANEKKTAT